MNWTSGHVWRALVNAEFLKTDFKYKFVVLYDDGGVMWEGGENRTFSMQSIEQLFPQLASEEADSFSNYKYHEELYSYERDKKCLKIMHKW